MINLVLLLISSTDVKKSTDKLIIFNEFWDRSEPGRRLTFSLPMPRLLRRKISNYRLKKKKKKQSQKIITTCGGKMCTQTLAQLSLWKQIVVV